MKAKYIFVCAILGLMIQPNLSHAVPKIYKLDFETASDYVFYQEDGNSELRTNVNALYGFNLTTYFATSAIANLPDGSHALKISYQTLFPDLPIPFSVTISKDLGPGQDQGYQYFGHDGMTNFYWENAAPPFWIASWDILTLNPNSPNGYDRETWNFDPSLQRKIFEISFSPDQSPLFLDNVVLLPIPEPSAQVMMSLGIALIAFRSNKKKSKSTLI